MLSILGKEVEIMKKITADEITKIRAFETSCDEMINGKFILADFKISNILKCIAQSKELYALLAECLLGFNFYAEFEKAKTSSSLKSEFKMPDEPYKRIALVFVFLAEVDSKKIRFYDFINSYFKSEEAGNEYGLFAKQFLTPFKNDIVSNFDLETPISEEEVSPSKQSKIEESIEDQLLKTLYEMQNIIDINTKIKDVRKEELSIYIRALIEAIKIKNKRIISALATALYKVIKKEKALHDTYNEFTSLLIRYY